MNEQVTIGVISDTHGYLNPGVFSIFDGVDHILHAGDIGNEDVIIELSAIAPVTAVSGNVDVDLPKKKYPPEREIEFYGKKIIMTHSDKYDWRLTHRLDAVLVKLNPDILIYGHTHIACCKKVDGVMFFNPGSAGRRRFKIKPSVGILSISKRGISGEIIYL